MPNYVSSPFRQIAFSYVWDVGTLRWIPGQQGTGGGGGGGDASAANQTIEITKLTSIDGKTPALVTGRVPVDGSGVTQPVSGTFWQATQPVSGTVTANAGSGPFPVSDNAGSLTVDNAGTFAVQASQSGTWNVSNISGTISLPTGASTESTLGTRLSESDFDTKTGSLTETAPATDTASSGLNGRLQRVSQRLTSLIALLPAALVGGRLDINAGSWLGSTAPTVGSKTSANSIPVVVASDQASIPVTASAGTNLNTSLLLLDTTFTGRINTQGQKAMTASTPVVLASDQTSIPVAATLSAETTKVIGTINISSGQSVGLATGANVIGSLVANQSVNVAQLNGVTPSVTNPLMVQLSDGVSVVNVTNYQQTLAMLAAQQLRVLQSQPVNGFIPVEIPSFLGA